MHRNLQASPDLIPESLMGSTGRTLETETNGSSPFTNGKTEACPSSQDVSDRVGLESGLLLSAQGPKPAASHKGRVQGGTWMLGPQLQESIPWYIHH